MKIDLYFIKFQIYKSLIKNTYIFEVEYKYPTIKIKNNKLNK